MFQTLSRMTSLSGFGVVGVVLEPLVLPNLLACGPSQNSPTALTFPFSHKPSSSHGDKGIDPPLPTLIGMELGNVVGNN
jgi:hypothetical protein